MHLSETKTLYLVRLWFAVRFRAKGRAGIFQLLCVASWCRLTSGNALLRPTMVACPALMQTSACLLPCLRPQEAP